MRRPAVVDDKFALPSIIFVLAMFRLYGYFKYRQGEDILFGAGLLLMAWAAWHDMLLGSLRSKTATKDRVFIFSGYFGLFLIAAGLVIWFIT